MKLQTKHKVAIIIAMITVIGGLITAILVKNEKQGNDKFENKNSITVVIDNKQPSVIETDPKNKANNNFSGRISTLEKLKNEGNDFLSNYDLLRKNFNTWKTKCKGILKETDSEIDKEFQNIENEFTTFDYHSQTLKIIELLDSEITNQKTKSK